MVSNHIKVKNKNLDIIVKYVAVIVAGVAQRLERHAHKLYL